MWGASSPKLIAFTQWSSLWIYMPAMQRLWVPVPGQYLRGDLYTEDSILHRAPSIVLTQPDLVMSLTEQLLCGSKCGVQAAPNLLPIQSCQVCSVKCLPPRDSGFQYRAVFEGRPLYWDSTPSQSSLYWKNNLALALYEVLFILLFKNDHIRFSQVKINKQDNWSYQVFHKTLKIL